MKDLFGRTLRECRKAAGFTLGDLADALGVSIPYLSDVERGNRAPFPMPRLHRAAAVLGCDLDRLVKDAGKSRGAFELTVDGVSERAQEVAAALSRGWEDFTPDQIEQIAQIVNGPTRKE